MDAQPTQWLDHRKSCSLQVGPAFQAITPHTPGVVRIFKNSRRAPTRWVPDGNEIQVPPLRDGNNNNVYFAGLFPSSSLPPSPPKMERFWHWGQRDSGTGVRKSVWHQGQGGGGQESGNLHWDQRMRAGNHRARLWGSTSLIFSRRLEKSVGLGRGVGDESRRGLPAIVSISNFTGVTRVSSDLRLCVWFFFWMGTGFLLFFFN